MKLSERIERDLKETAERVEREVREATGGRYAPEAIDWEARAMSVRHLREAVTASSFAPLLRSGVQSFLFDGYQRPPVIYPQLFRVVNSTARQELYAPLYMTELPEEVRPGEEFQDSAIQGMAMQLVNRKWGRRLDIERELIDDDQTGQIIDKATELGRNMRIREELHAMDVLFGGFLADGTTGAYSTAAQRNQVAAPGPLNADRLKEADLLLEFMEDPLGNRMLSNPTHLIYGGQFKFDVAALLNSTFNPTTQTGNSVLGGAAFAINPLQGLYTPLKAPMAPRLGLDGVNGPWLLGEPARGLVWQDRDPLEVTQENPGAGAAFTNDVYRYRVRRRFVAGHIESRFMVRGN